MAEALAKNKLSSQWHIVSRGLSVSYGQGANKKSIIAMDMENLDIRQHKAQRFDPMETTEKTLVLTMTHGHKDYLLAYYPELKGRVFTLPEYVEINGEISDPYGAGQEVYNQCAQTIKRAIEKLALKLK